MNKLELLAEKYSNKVAQSFDMADIQILERVAKLLKAKAKNVFARLAVVESAVKSGLIAHNVVLVDCSLNRCIIAHKTFYTASRFEAKQTMIAENKALLSELSSLAVMAY